MAGALPKTGYLDGGRYNVAIRACGELVLFGLASDERPPRLSGRVRRSFLAAINTETRLAIPIDEMLHALFGKPPFP